MLTGERRTKRSELIPETNSAYLNIYDVLMLSRLDQGSSDSGTSAGGVLGD
jgi:hypothetical protein